MCADKHRSKMWVFLLIYSLGVNICQAAGMGNSTQMYYATLKIDKSVFDIIRQALSGFSTHNSSFLIEDLKMTTNCTNDGQSKLSCSCMSGYKWSDQVCQSDQTCCQNRCSFPNTSAMMCVSDSTVRITGSITLGATEYQTCLTDKALEPFQTCNRNMLNVMKMFYSTLRGFDTLKIQSYSAGSVIVNFGMTIVSNVTSQELIDISIKLNENLTASMILETTGIVSLPIPTEPVQYNQSATINCTTREDLGYTPKWSLNNPSGQFLITNGTISKMTIGYKETKLTLSNVNELWKGEYVCLYVQQKNSTTINHKANGTMNICLIPSIRSFTDPAFPRCRSSTDVKVVKVTCVIDKTSENYHVSWSPYVVQQGNSSDQRTQTFIAEKVVSCDPNSTVESTMSNLSCNFTNGCNQTTEKKVAITMIYANDPFCAADGDWGDTKEGFTAEIQCANQAGVRKRACKHGTWQNEVSQCVNLQLHDVLQSAIISDIGLGELSVNAADVFSRFENVTKTVMLNTFSNVNTSVVVLSTLKPKLTFLNNDSAVQNFLDSSSNLLNNSLESSWNSTADNLMADSYLSSVEQLIRISNITDTSKKPNLEVVTCSQGLCNNKVFNATVTIQSSTQVKTTGFQFLQNYLPNNDSTSVPNSIVVSTTAGNQTNTEITINFTLINPRPRNVALKCVFWDSATKSWSPEGCKWAGTSSEGTCTCTHLSSFAILMSKEPLEIPGLDQLTYAGLGISILSLLISLVIELIVWSDVVKTNTLYLRHTAHVNISLCLLVANACFLASSNPKDMTDIWCRTSVVLKHFCYLAMFFWMLCLSFTLLHQAVFLFHKVSKTNYLRFSLVLGYGGPLIIVFVTFLTNSAGAKGVYYSGDTCWLVYDGLLKGSIFTFIIPVGIIVFVNVFSMFVVIMKLLSHHHNADVSQEKEKAAAKTVLRSVILLTPIFGVTWVFGFALMIFDLTEGQLAYVINYVFVALNAFQGFFILLTSCLGDKMTREALMKHLRKKAPVSSMSESTTKTNSSIKK